MDLGWLLHTAYTYVYVLTYTIYLKLTRTRLKNVRLLVGKTALVTGGNNGIGYNVCLNLASRGCRVIMVDKDDPEESRRRIIEETGNKEVICKKVDLVDFYAVRGLATDILNAEDKLDILVNNAGIGASNKLTKDGVHLVMAVNHLGPFLLTHLLQDLMKKTPNSRTLFTSSCMALFYTKEPGDLMGDLSLYDAYPCSKLAVIMGSDYFARQFKGTGATCNSFHPGAVTTGIMDEVLWKDFGIHALIEKCFFEIFHRIAGTSPWDVSENVVALVTSKQFERHNGEFFFEDRVYAKPYFADDPVAANKVLSSTRRILGID